MAAHPPRTVPSPLAGDDRRARHRLSARVVGYWRWRMVASNLPLVLVLGGLAWTLPWGPPWLWWTIVAVVAATVVVGMVVVPPIRYRVFWYALAPSEIDVQHGVIFIKRTVVPMHRVQSVRTERGPIADRYGMTNLRLRTAAGSLQIGGLLTPEADQVCAEVSALARLADDV